MYRPYQNKSSLRRKNSRILQGGTSETSGDKISWWERRNIAGRDAREFNYTITNATAGRPDLVSFEFYGTTEYEWIVLQYNNIIDISEEFVYGKVLRLPSKTFVITNIINKPAGSFAG